MGNAKQNTDPSNNKPLDGKASRSRMTRQAAFLELTVYGEDLRCVDPTRQVLMGR